MSSLAMWYKEVTKVRVGIFMNLVACKWLIYEVYLTKNESYFSFHKIDISRQAHHERRESRPRVVAWLCRNIHL